MTSHSIITEVLCRNVVKAVKSHSAKPPAKITWDPQTGFSGQPPAPPLLPALCWGSHTSTRWLQLLCGVLPHTSPLDALPYQSQS